MKTKSVLSNKLMSFLNQAFLFVIFYLSQLDGYTSKQGNLKCTLWTFEHVTDSKSFVCSRLCSSNVISLILCCAFFFHFNNFFLQKRKPAEAEFYNSRHHRTRKEENSHNFLAMKIKKHEVSLSVFLKLSWK